MVSVYTRAARSLKYHDFSCTIIRLPNCQCFLCQDLIYYKFLSESTCIPISFQSSLARCMEGQFLYKEAVQCALYSCWHVQKVYPLTVCVRTICVFQFDRYDQIDGRISELDFSRLMLSYATINQQRKKKHFKRIKRVYGSGLSDCPEAKVHSYDIMLGLGTLC